MERPKHHVREWRKFRHLTQTQLAERMGVTQGYISQIEGNVTRYDQNFLEAASKVLHCTPAELIGVDPTKPANGIWSIWDSIPAADKPKAATILQAFTKKPEDK